MGVQELFRETRPSQNSHYEKGDLAPRVGCMRQQTGNRQPYFAITDSQS